MIMKAVKAQAIVDEALTWVRTPFVHQGRIKGVGVDCVNFIAEVARATGATPDVDFERNYRRTEDGQQLLKELIHYLEPVESLEDIKPADILAFHDGFDHDTNRHLAFVTQLTPYVKIVHASKRGVVCHRLDAHFRSLVSSVWRRPGLVYD